MAVVVVWTALAALPAAGQCPARWLPGASVPGTDGTVYASIVLSGGDILVGGAFTLAGGQPAQNFARWNAAGHSWSNIGSRVNGDVFALASFPNGDIAVAGSFTISGLPGGNSIARFDPTTEAWTAMGTGVANGQIDAIAFTPEGDLVAVGNFGLAGGVAVQGMARYRPATNDWISQGAGTNRGLHAVVVAPSGDIYVGGIFTSGPAVNSNGIGRRSSSGVWTAVGGDLVGGIASAIAVLPSGDILVGGAFTAAVDVSGTVPVAAIARWSPSTSRWSAMGTGLSGTGRRVNALLVLPGGEVLAGGNFAGAGSVPANNIARYSNGVWAALGQGTSGPVTCFGPQPGGGGGGHSDVVVGGGFLTVNGVAARNVATLDHASATWTVLGEGVDGTINAFATLPPISGGDLFAGGTFTRAGQVPAANIARHHAATNEWSTLGSGVSGNVLAMTVTPGGDLIVGGEFGTAGGGQVGRIARWNPIAAAWSNFGSGISPAPEQGRVTALAALANGDVIAGGTFTSAGGTLAINIARWNVAASAWAPMGAGMNGAVRALLVLPGGDILAGGEFSTAGSVFAGSVARWSDATHSWSAIGAGTDGTVYALALLTSGEVIVAGEFAHAGGIAARNIARWNPMSGTWAALGAGTDFQINSLAVAPALVGGDLYVGGSFVAAGAVAANRVARYRFATGTWAPLAGGLNAPALALAVHPGGVGNGNVLGDVYAGGAFTTAGGLVSANFARWSSHPTCQGDFDCNGMLNAQDIFAFLNAWFAGDAAANAGGTGGLDVQDVFEFINAWFAGCRL